MTKRIGLYLGLGSALLILMAEPFGGLSTVGHRTLAVSVLMAVWWATECIPIPVTALIPMILFPALQIASIRDTTTPYGHPLVFLFLGGFLIAIALEKWNLHRRIALSILDKSSNTPSALIGGFMFVSAALSMWVTNTATTMMLLPIALSVADLLTQTDDDKKSKIFCSALLLAIAYSSSIGGMMTIIGTVPNTILAGFIQDQAAIEISFLSWMKIGVPLALILLPIVWILLTRIIYKVNGLKVSASKSFLHKLYQELGPMSPEEKRTMFVFVCTALFWTFKEPLNRYVLPFEISDTGIGILGGFMLFVVPSSKGSEKLLNWNDTHGLPWSLLLMFGGGLSLASAIQSSGVSTWIGSSIVEYKDWSPLIIILIVTSVTIFVTELTSNTATTATFLPIIFPIAVTLDMDPLLLLFPATLAASCAFMLPVATPPNAIVYGSARVTIPEMMKAGFWLNVISIFVITLLTYSLVPLLR